MNELDESLGSREPIEEHLPSSRSNNARFSYQNKHILVTCRLQWQGVKVMFTLPKAFLGLAIVTMVGFNVPVVSAQRSSQVDELVVAIVGDRQIRMTDLDAQIRESLQALQSEIYTLRREKLGQMIEKMLFEQEAQKHGQSAEEFVQAVFDNAILSEQELDEIYTRNESRFLKQQMSETESKEYIRRSLNRRRGSERYQSVLRELREKSGVQIYLEETEPLRIDVSPDDDAYKGPMDAPVTIIEFSDFQCPFCKQFQQVVTRLLEAYPTQVRLVYRDFPLPSHPNAFQAAEAAECAKEQGKFWEYHDLLFENNTELDKESLKLYATQLGLESGGFDNCLELGRYSSEVRMDRQDGLVAGVESTPTVFVNGIALRGTLPFEAYRSYVERELKKAGIGTAAF